MRLFKAASVHLPIRQPATTCPSGSPRSCSSHMSQRQGTLIRGYLILFRGALTQSCQPPLTPARTLHLPAAQPRVARGMFWNYLSLGLDAEAAYGFHTLREQYAWAASNRLANQAWYSWFSCTSGWFCGAQVGAVRG